MFQIGPYAKLDEERFFVSMDFDYEDKAIRERGFLHIETCTFEEFAKNDTRIFGPLEVLHDGCPTEFSGVSFLENLRREFFVLSVPVITLFSQRELWKSRSER